MVALIELLRRNVDDCRHTYSTWQCLLVSTVQPTPECLYHTFTSKTPCTLYTKINLDIIDRDKSNIFAFVAENLSRAWILLFTESLHRRCFLNSKIANLIPLNTVARVIISDIKQHRNMKSSCIPRSIAKRTNDEFF